MEQINYQLIKRLDDRYGTPFYIMSPDMYRHNINGFINAFKRKYDRIIAGYSFKTNYVPALCKIAKEEGCFAEVVSDMEYALAKAGFNRLFSMANKRDAVLAQAIEDDAIINLDSEYEVDAVCYYKEQHPSSDLKVGMRININLTDENSIAQSSAAKIWAVWISRRYYWKEHKKASSERHKDYFFTWPYFNIR